VGEVVFLDEWKAQRQQKLEPTKGWRNEDGKLVCPKCSSELFGAYSNPPGWKRKRKAPESERHFHLSCAFGCGWKSAPHREHLQAEWLACPGCAINPGQPFWSESTPERVSPA
jgi:hypothetical protein